MHDADRRQRRGFAIGRHQGARRGFLHRRADRGDGARRLRRRRREGGAAGGGRSQPAHHASVGELSEIGRELSLAARFPGEALAGNRSQERGGAGGLRQADRDGGHPDRQLPAEGAREAQDALRGRGVCQSPPDLCVLHGLWRDGPRCRPGRLRRQRLFRAFRSRRRLPL